MAEETRQKLKRRRDEEADEGADNQFRTKLPSQVSSQHGSSSHLYSVINLEGNAQAILGNVHGLDDRFFRDPGHTDAKELVLKALYFESMRSRKEQIDARAGSPRYVEWIWSTNFATWLEGPESFYWITGRPGSGKSTLMNHICASRRTLEALQRSASGQKWTTLHFFFDFRAGHSAASSIEGMLRSLLYQLVKRVPDAIQHVDHALYADSLQHGGLNDCMSNLCDALGFSTTRVCAFIDGLDEFEGPSSELLEVIHKLEDRTGLKICLASRPYPVFEGGLSRYPHLDVQDHNDESIRLYAESQWANSRLDLKATLPRQLSDEVRDKANGVFLWARLATDELLRGFLAGNSVDDLRQQLREMPAEVREMYQRILDRLPQVLQSEAAILLYMIVAATSRVRVQKLYVALDAILRKPGSTIEILALPSYQDNDSRIAALLGDFLDFSSTGLSDPRVRNRLDDEDSPVPGVVVENSLPVLERTIRTCVALTHETLRSFLLESTWLRRHLPQEMTIGNITSCWLDLYLDELANCVLRCNVNEIALNRKNQTYIEKLEKHFVDKRVFGGPYEEELMELLAFWTRWTPLLPYALTEIFREIRSCSTIEPHFALLQQIPPSAFHTLHSGMCMFEHRDSYQPGGDSCAYLICNVGKGFNEHTETLGKDVTLAFCHDWPAYIRHHLSGNLSMELETAQYLFDLVWDRYSQERYYAEENIDEYELLLRSLIARGCRMKGLHLCVLRRQQHIAKTAAPVSFLSQHLWQQKLEHLPNCTYRHERSTGCGFLSHWAEIKTIRAADGTLVPLLQVLLACGQDVNQVCEVNKEPVLNVILQTCLDGNLRYGDGSRIAKLVAALEAGADPYTAGASGNVFDVADKVLQGLTDRRRKNNPYFQPMLDMTIEVVRKLVELLQYYVNSNNTLPSNLNEYLKWDR